MNSAETQFLAALRRELAELESIAPDTYDVAGWVVPDEVVDRAIELTRARIVAPQAKECAA